ncbi:pectinesterase inhibitor 28-like [Aristolochia californica]|uniref:pectinesterase inhibitor 28-like n=1 Tax=Aristolochia californica TaxID=171875 RepID=UPI0035DA20DC
MGNLDLVMETCNSIKDRQFCIVTFAYDSWSLTSDVPGLAKIGAQYALSNSTGIINYLSQLGGDAVTVEIENGCEVAYSDAVKGLGDTIRDLNSKDYDKAAARVGGAAEKPNACEKLFRDKGREYPPELAHWAEIVQSLCYVSYEIIVQLH